MKFENLSRPGEQIKPGDKVKQIGQGFEAVFYWPLDAEKDPEGIPYEQSPDA